VVRYTRREALTIVADVVRAMIQMAPNAVFFQTPLGPELGGEPVAEWVGLVDDLKRVVAAAKIVSMRGAVEQIPRSRVFLPNGHYTDEATTLYGHAIARELIRETQLTRP